MANAKAGKKARSRGRILESAGVLLREKGISGASVAGVMDGAGMTVGGFYAHFPSKRSLVAEALLETMRRTRGLLAAAAGDRQGADWVNAVARSYLSRQHRDSPETGCPLPAILGEVARGDPEVREALAVALGETVEELASRLRAAGVEDGDGEAAAVLATMVGGLSLARALRGSELSDGMLQACRRHIARSLPPRP